jgi:acetylornithine deacetylase/succinyl-diaminopimelate desuccinylase-like protein
MKGGISAFITAAAASSAPLKIFLAVDEENISTGAWAAVRHRPSFFKDASLIISAEPNFGLGDHSLTIGRTGRYVFQIEFIGRPAHLANQSAGVDAIAAAADFITRFYRRKSRLFASPDTVAQVRRITAESVGMSVCARAVLEVEILAGALDTRTEIKNCLGRMSHARVSLVPRTTPYLPGYHFSAFPFRREISAIVRRHTGRSVRLVTRSSVADDNVLATLGTPVITWGPSGGQAHAANEYLSRSSLERFISMYSDLLSAAGS